MLTDRYGLTLSTSVDAVRDHYVAAVDLILANQPGADLSLQAALKLDPEFCMGYAGLARHYQMWGRVAEARASIAQALPYSLKASKREQQHINLQASLIHGDAPKAFRQLLEHLKDYPRDALALGMALGAFGMLAFSGRPDHDKARLVLTERFSKDYGDDWWYLCYLAWAHIEAGSLAQGEKHIEKSLALKADNANAMHVFAHLAYEQNRASDSLARFNALSQHYSDKALLHNHLRWHAALAELSAGRINLALETYDQYLSPLVATAPPITAISDAVSLLWRIDVAYDASRNFSPNTSSPTASSPTWERWQVLRESVKARSYQSSVAFLDVHVAALFGVAEERAVFDALVAQVANVMPIKGSPLGPTVVALCRALQAYAQENFQEAVALLESNLGNVVRIGGSGAQRDLLKETLASAYLRASASREPALAK